MRKLLSLVVVAFTATLAHADKVAPPAPVAVEFVINGQEIAIGNEDIETDPAARYPGMLNGLIEGLAKAPMNIVLPEASLVGVVNYADVAEIRWPLRDVAMMSAAVLGSEKDYYKKIGTAMVAGIDQGMAELALVHADRKFLVVIGDGTDTNPDVAKQALTGLRERAAKQGIEPMAIIYKNELSIPSNEVTRLDPDAQTVYSASGIMPAVDQRLMLALAKVPVVPVVVPVIIQTPATCTSWFSQWRWQLAIGSALALIAMGGVWFVRRERM